MFNKFLFTIFSVCIIQNSIAQNNYELSNFPDKDDDNEFFEQLFGGNGELNNPFTLLKIDIKEAPLYFVGAKGGMKDFFKVKYKISDSAAELKLKAFLKNKCKFSIADTIIFSRDMGIASIKLYPDTLLDNYRRMELLNFLDKYCPLKDTKYPTLSVLVIAYMFERRIFVDTNYTTISYYSKFVFRDKYKVIWDYDIRKWIKK